jgi:hypothetical protein
VVSGGDGLENFRMHASIVVAGEAANRFHGENTLAEAAVVRASGK